MTVIIRNTETAKTGTRTEFKSSEYAVSRREDCRDGVDAQVYDLVLMMGATIKMGQVTGRPA